MLDFEFSHSVKYWLSTQTKYMVINFLDFDSTYYYYHYIFTPMNCKSNSKQEIMSYEAAKHLFL